MRPPPQLRRNFYRAEGHRLNMDVDPRLSSILSVIEGHPRAVSAFMDFLHSLQVEKQASHQAAQRRLGPLFRVWSASLARVRLIMPLRPPPGSRMRNMPRYTASGTTP
jgi:hypothetical protein